jgi:hypothetical protein
LNPRSKTLQTFSCKEETRTGKRELKGGYPMARLFGRKSSEGEGRSRVAGSRGKALYPDEYVQELTPLDIINQDTDVLTDEIEYVFKLPSAPLEIADYFGHYFLPAEKSA